MKLRVLSTKYCGVIHYIYIYIYINHQTKESTYIYFYLKFHALTRSSESMYATSNTHSGQHHEYILVTRMNTEEKKIGQGKSKREKQMGDVTRCRWLVIGV